MPKRHREILCPEITDPKRRVFLDVVPTVRRIQNSILDMQEKTGERIDVPLEGREVTVWLHRAPGERRPVLFEFHGGGYVFGDAAADDGFCEEVCRLSGWHVAGVSYRLAPEHRFPDQLNDAWEVMQWFRDHAEQYAMDSGCMAVTGFSAGGNLAAAAALKAVQEGQTWLKAQILHYPFLDFFLETDQLETFDEDIDPLLMNGFLDSFCSREEMEDPLVSPARASDEDIRRMIPTLLIPAERDRLRKQGLQYGKRLQDAGAEVICRVLPETHHCYIEDACNQELYDKTVLPEKKRQHSPHFRERAEEAVQMTAEFLRGHMSATDT